MDIKEIIHRFGARFWAAEKKAEKKIHEVEEFAAHAAHDAGDAVIKAERKVFQLTRDFLRMEASGGILLMIAALVAIILANSPLYGFYHYILEGMEFRIGFSDLDMSFDAELKKSILHWINDGLMAIFFFLIGLEVKREFLTGELSSRERAILPALAAIGGMIAPALFFWGFNHDIPGNLDGWAIPAATDIAFALGVLALLGSRAPASLKVLLMAIAVIDDIGAILIIAVFYSHDIWLTPLYIAAGALLVLFALNRAHVARRAPYLMMTVILWIAVLESGLHATLAGVVAALFIPIADKKKPGVSPLKDLEHGLHPWVAFGVLPLFAFANAGVSFKGMGFDDIFNPVSVGIAAGLVAGKQIGIFGMLWLAIVTGLSPKPKGTTWLQLYAVSVLCGIGFTMSLFIGTLAYSSLDMQVSVRVGVMAGTIFSALGGYLLLLYSTGSSASYSQPPVSEENNHDK